MTHRLTKVIDNFSHDISIAELHRLYMDREGHDLSYHDTLYLNIIDAHPNRYTSSQIADLLKVTRPAVTQKINELTKKGYIIRTQSEKDKRVFYLSVNPQKGYYTDKDRELEKEMIEKMEKTFGADSLDLLCDMLEFYAEGRYNETFKEQNNDR